MSLDRGRIGLHAPADFAKERVSPEFPHGKCSRVECLAIGEADTVKHKDSAAITPIQEISASVLSIEGSVQALFLDGRVNREQAWRSSGSMVVQPKEPYNRSFHKRALAMCGHDRGSATTSFAEYLLRKTNGKSAARTNDVSGLRWRPQPISRVNALPKSQF